MMKQVETEDWAPKHTSNHSLMGRYLFGGAKIVPHIVVLSQFFQTWHRVC